MAALPFFPFATDAYMTDCEHLGDAEHGRYLLILINLWRAPRQRLPNDDDWLARRFRRSVERVRAELRPLIAEFCQNDGNWITQKRVSREFKRAMKLVKQRRAAAKARWRKEKASCGRKSERMSAAIVPTLTPTLTESFLTDPARAKEATRIMQDVATAVTAAAAKKGRQE